MKPKSKQVAVLVGAALVLWAPTTVTAQCDGDCCGECSVSGDPCRTDADCGVGEVCEDPNGEGLYYYTTSNYINVEGGQVSMAGATLFVDFFEQQSSTNDWIDVDFNGWSGYDSTCDPPPCNVHPPFGVDFLSSMFLPGFNLDTHWAFQYRSIGSVNGFNEFVENQTCGVIPFDPPSERGIFNVGFQWASGGSASYNGANYSGTPLEPCEIEGAFLDVPSSWAIQVDGDGEWNVPPLGDGYGKGSGILSTSGFESKLQTLTRDCGVCEEVYRVRRTNNIPNGLRDQNLCMSTLGGLYQTCASVTNGTPELIPCVSDSDCPWYECHDGLGFTGVKCGPSPAAANACGVDEDCLPRDTCMVTAPDTSLNKNFASPDADTIYDYVSAWVPVSIIANRGVGDSGIKYSEAQWLFITGRMPNGENLVAATRDVGSGTRNAAMNSLGIDTSWGRGENIGSKEKSSSTDPLGPLWQPSNRGGSSRMEGTVQNGRLSVGYTGLAGTSRSGLDADKGKYEIMGVCKDVDQNGDPLCDCDTTGYVRPSVNTVLDNCDPCSGYQIAGSGSFVVRGDLDTNRWGYCASGGPGGQRCVVDEDCDPGDSCVNPGYSEPPNAGVPLDNQAVADYLNNIFDSVASFEQELVLPGECMFATGVQCSTDADCPTHLCCSDNEDRTCTVEGDPCYGTCDGDPGVQCTSDQDCTDAGTTGPCNGYDGTCDVCSTEDVCKRKLNMPGQYLATTFFLPKGLDCIHVLDSPLEYAYESECCTFGQCSTSGDPCDYDNPCPGGQTCDVILCTEDGECEPDFGTCDPCPANQELQDFMRANNGLGWGASADGHEYDYGVNNVAGQVPLRTALAIGDNYSDGSRGQYYFWDGVQHLTVAGHTDLSARNLVQADFNGDLIRDVDDVGGSCGTDPQEMVIAWSAPRGWAESSCAEDVALGRLDPDFKRPEDPTEANRMFAGSAIPEVLADFDGDGNFTKEDLRYWMDGLAMNDDGSGRKLDRKAGAIAIDNALISNIEGICSASYMCYESNGSLTADPACPTPDGTCGTNGVCVARRCSVDAHCHVAMDQCMDFLPWAAEEPTLWVNWELNPPQEPEFKRPVDIIEMFPADLVTNTGKTYDAGDFRADINGRKLWECTFSGNACYDDTDCDPVGFPGDECDTDGRGFVGGAQPMRWDGKIDDKDIDYVCRNIGDWANLSEAIYVDLSADMDGDTDVDYGDVYELVVNVLGTRLGDVNIDGVRDEADEAIVQATIDAGAAGCNGDASCGWADGDSNCDGVVDGEDMLAVSCFFASPAQPELLDLPSDPESQKIRYLSVIASDAGHSQAVRVTFSGVPAPYDHWIGLELWVQQPQAYCENAGVSQADPCPLSTGGLPSTEFWGAQLGCAPYVTDWTQYDTVHVFNEGIIPGGTYDVQVIDATCSLDVEYNYSDALTLTQSTWADLIQDCTTTPCKPPDGSTGIVDVTAIMDKWKNLPGNVKKVRADIEGSPAGDHRLPDQAINITDVTYCLSAFLGDEYPGPGFPEPSDPPVCP